MSGSAGPKSSIDLNEWLGDPTIVGGWSLDAAASKSEFHVKHFWGAITVHGSFREMSGEATVGATGTVTAELHIKASSLNTGNARRDDHLRSSDFFGAEQHPEVVVTIAEVRPAGPSDLACQGSLQAAGHTEPVSFTVEVLEAGPISLRLTAELVVDRTGLGMTWSPLHVASRQARLTAALRFVRS